MSRTSRLTWDQIHRRSTPVDPPADHAPEPDGPSTVTRTRRGNVIHVPLAWVGRFTTRKTIRERRKPKPASWKQKQRIDADNVDRKEQA